MSIEELFPIRSRVRLRGSAQPMVVRSVNGDCRTVTWLGSIDGALKAIEMADVPVGLLELIPIDDPCLQGNP